MAWEKRASRRYYYRSVRHDGRVTKIYCGGGSAGQAAAAEDEARHTRLRAETAAWLAKQVRLEPLIALTRQMQAVAQLLADAVLLTAGFHRAKNRQPWRPWENGRHILRCTLDPGSETGTACRTPEAQELRDLVKRAKAGDSSVLPRLRDILDDHPEVWSWLGDLSRITREGWIKELVPTEPHICESIRRQADALCNELCGEHPTATEKLLADQVVACWLEVEYSRNALTLGNRHAGSRSQFLVKWSETALRKYLTALRTLATVRARLPQGLAPLNTLRLHVAEPKTA